MLDVSHAGGDRPAGGIGTHQPDSNGAGRHADGAEEAANSAKDRSCDHLPGIASVERDAATGNDGPHDGTCRAEASMHLIHFLQGQFLNALDIARFAPH